MSSYNQARVDVKFGDWISEGFRMFVEQWQAWVVQTLVLIAVLLALMFLEAIGFIAISALLGLALGDASPVLILIMLPLLLGIALIVSSGLVCGMYKSAFKQLTGGRIELSDLFSGMDSFLPVVLAQLCIGVLSVVGLLFCIIPAYIVGGLLYFTVPLIIHRNLSVSEALGTSFEVTKQNILMFTLFAFVVAIIAQIGSYACYVGLLATFPLQFTIGAIAYRDCFGVTGARSFQPPPAQPAPYASSPPGWPPSAVPPQPGFCPACQTPIALGTRFCPACGTATS